MPISSLRAADIKPLKTRILVRKYKRPEKVGSIFLNPAWLVDNSRALWEVVKASAKAEEYLGVALPPETILVTLPSRGVHVILDEPEEHYFLFAEEVVKIINWTEEDEET